MRGQHLTKINRRDFDFSKNGARKPVFLNKQIDRDDLYFEVLDSKEATEEEKIAELVIKVNR